MSKQKPKKRVGYVIRVKDNSWYMHNEWIMLKGCISVPMDTHIHLSDCYKGIGEAKAAVTRLTLGGTDCTKCTYEVLTLKFPDSDTSICLKEYLKEV